VAVVGSLERCKVKGCRFLVTIIDLASHFPLAYPVQEHTAAEVAKCLINALSLFGFPCEILSDQGTEFLSEIMRVFLRECNVKHIKASVNHPQTNGSLERFHRCLKNMLKAVLHDNPNASWEEVLPWVLFAYREVPVQGLGFSACDLMFGRSVRGPLYLIRSQWLNDLKKQNLFDFVNMYVVHYKQRMHLL